MALESHLKELGEKHRKVDEQLQAERLHPSIDPLKLTELKKQKLRLKEEMEQCRAKLQ